MKKWLAVAGTILLLLSLATVVLAAGPGPVRLVVNGQEIKPDVPPQLINGRTMVPVRWAAEALGADVNWDQSTQTVSITDRQQQNQMRVKLLEAALAPQTPEEAVNTWIRGVKTRNGALQFAVMSPELRKLYQADFESMNWVTGVSSPWVDSCQIVNKSRDGEVYKFEIKCNMAASTGPAGSDTALIVVGKQPDNPEQWYVTEIDYPTDSLYNYHRVLLTEYNISLPIPVTWEIGRTNNEIKILNNQGEVIGGIDRLGGAFLPNHSEVLSEKKVATGLGEGKLSVLRRSNPAASGINDEWEEVHVLLPFDHQSQLDFWVKAGPPEDTQQLAAVVEKAVRGIQKQ